MCQEHVTARPDDSVLVDNLSLAFSLCLSIPVAGLITLQTALQEGDWQQAPPSCLPCRATTSGNLGSMFPTHCPRAPATDILFLKREELLQQTQLQQQCSLSLKPQNTLKAAVVVTVIVDIRFLPSLSLGSEIKNNRRDPKNAGKRAHWWFWQINHDLWRVKQTHYLCIKPGGRQQSGLFWHYSA